MTLSRNGPFNLVIPPQELLFFSRDRFAIYFVPIFSGSSVTSPPAFFFCFFFFPVDSSSDGLDFVRAFVADFHFVRGLPKLIRRFLPLPVLLDSFFSELVDESASLFPPEEKFFPGTPPTARLSRFRELTNGPVPPRFPFNTS